MASSIRDLEAAAARGWQAGFAGHHGYHYRVAPR
jgi:hypothetical protein